MTRVYGLARRWGSPGPADEHVTGRSRLQGSPQAAPACRTFPSAMFYTLGKPIWQTNIERRP